MKTKMMPIRMEQIMANILEDKLKNTYINSSAAIRACIAQLINMERKEMLMFISKGTSMAEKIEKEIYVTVEDKIDTPKEI